MKTYLILALTFFLSANYFSQTEQFSCFIDRQDFTNIVVVNGEDSTYLTKDNQNKRVFNESEVSYKFAYGKGREKDVNGIRERKKRYVVSSNQDTLLYTLWGGSTIQLNDSIKVERIKTDYGWQYIQEDSTVLCELDLMWNESSWNYNIQFFNPDEKTEKLKKVVMLSLVEMAAKRSKCKCDDGDDDTLFFVLWAASLATNSCN